MIKRIKKELGNDYDVEKHFSPSYNPWDQRICLVPDSDLFKAIKSKQLSIKTDIIKFTGTRSMGGKNGRRYIELYWAS